MEVFNQIWSTFLGVIKSFQVADALDVILVTFFLYKGIQFIRKTRAAQFIKAILIVVALWAVCYYLNLHMMISFLNIFFQFGVIALIVIFQPELRSVLDQIGRSRVSKFISNNFFSSNTEDEIIHATRRAITVISEAATTMSRTKTGALIVFERRTNLNDIIDTGTIMQATPSEEMVGNIFFNKAPLHDGAMIIRDGSIYAAGCILPLTKNKNVDSSLGTRHRAALGMSENSDAVIVVVSEETGQISIALGGLLHRDFTRESLSNELEDLLITDELKPAKKSFRKEGKKK